MSPLPDPWVNTNPLLQAPDQGKKAAAPEDLPSGCRAPCSRPTRSDYGISFPDFPGYVSAGVTHTEAIGLGHEALRLHIDGMVDDGESIPIPSAVEEHRG